MHVFPSYRYHPVEGTRVVATEAEHEEAAAAGWFETPADFPEPEAEPEPKPRKR